MASRPAALRLSGRLDPRLPPAIAAGLLLLLFALLLPGLMARIHHHRALAHLKAGDLASAEARINQVRQWLPGYFFTNDHLRLALAEGDLHFRLAEQTTTLKGFLDQMENARAAYRRAAILQPLDLHALTGLARSVEALERVSPAIEKRPYPESARPIFAELLRLMPVNIHAHRLHIDYLHRFQAPEDELHAAIAQAISLYPPLYFELRDRSFATPDLDGLLADRLEAAVAEAIFPAEAQRALADLALRGGDAVRAAAWYRSSIPRQTYRDIAHLYLHLGGLELQAEDFAAAEIAFLQALHSGNREDKLRRIHSNYAQHDAHRRFLDFADLVEKQHVLPEYLEILRAQALIALDLPALATTRLLRISDPDHLAESYYLLAKIAEKAEDWDAMELKAQRATVLAPYNSSYHLLFSQALQHQKKWPQAEKAGSAAIDYSEQCNPWLYNHRAWLRLQQSNVDGAEADWQRAVQLSPETAHFYYQLALIYTESGNRTAALRTIDRAITLKPEHAGYRDRRALLQADN